MYDIPFAYDACTDMQDDINRIEKWAAIFLNPKELVETIFKNTLKNHIQISKDLISLVSTFLIGMYYDSGFDMADFLVLAIGPVPELPTEIIDICLINES